jgi:hypothetical protein
MRLAYIITAYKLPGQFVRLIRALQSPNATFFVHIDKKTPPDSFEEMHDGVKEFSNVYFLERHKIWWADYYHVQAILKGVDALINSKISVDYVLILTGQCYPIKSNGYIEDFFTRSAGKSFIEWRSLPDEKWDVMDRLERWFFPIFNRPTGFPPRLIGTRFARFQFAEKFINLFFPKRAFLPGLKPFGGEAYWNLSREATEYVYDYVHQHPEFVRFFERTVCPDEHFFQTLMLNSPLAESLTNDSLRYIDWMYQRNHPAILKEGDFARLAASPKLFARKFDSSVDSRILDMIDEQLRR